MAFFNIENYLNKFRNIKPPKDSVKAEAVLIIKDLFGVLLESKDMNYRSGTLFIKSKDPVLKNEIFIKKAKILELLSKKLGSKSPKDLRF